MRRRKKHRQPGRRRGGLRFFFVLAAVIVLALVIDGQMRPAIEATSAYQAKLYAMRYINQAMAAELERSGLEYGDMISLSQDSQGQVTAVQTDMVALNRLKTNMVGAIISQLEKEENQQLEIPLGTMFGNQLTTGRGPMVPVRITPTGYVQSEVHNQFTSAGINQTLHQVVLQVNVELIAVLPGYSIQTSTATSYCVAQTIIVGTVPEGFTEINGDESSLIAKYNDYNQTEMGG